MKKPTFLLLFSGGLASTTSLLKAVTENRVPLLFFYHNAGPAGTGELKAVRTFAERYKMPLQIARDDASILRLPIVERERHVIDAACIFAGQQELTAVVLGRKSFFTRDPPPKRSQPVPVLFIPQNEPGDEQYKAALDFDPNLFDDSFSCSESYSERPCEKCSKCRERQSLYSRIRTH